MFLLSFIWVLIAYYYALIGIDLVSGQGENLLRYPRPCENQTHFSAKQKELCDRFQLVTYAMVEGAVAGLKWCQRVMAAEQWDCTSYEGDGQLIYYEDDGGTKEAALMTAMRAAGMVDSLTAGFTSGVVPCPEVHMNQIPASRKIWSRQCPSSVIQTAYKHVYEFMGFDVEPPFEDPSWLIAQHNAQAAMKLVMRLMWCDYQMYPWDVCNKMLRHREDVANELYKMYKNAVRVTVQRGFLLLVNPERDGINGSIEVHDTQLAFLVDSESLNDYCRRQGDRKGRTCYRHRITERRNTSSINGTMTTHEEQTTIVDDTHRQTKALESCRLLCCNEALFEMRIRYDRWEDGQRVIEHICP